jgi:hypothetical protein
LGALRLTPATSSNEKENTARKRRKPSSENRNIRLSMSLRKCNEIGPGDRVGVQ